MKTILIYLHINKAVNQRQIFASSRFETVTKSQTKFYLTSCYYSQTFGNTLNQRVANDDSDFSKGFFTNLSK
jgi:hypothetical protein